jgi:hypothetical protein
MVLFLDVRLLTFLVLARVGTGRLVSFQTSGNVGHVGNVGPVGNAGTAERVASLVVSSSVVSLVTTLLFLSFWKVN